MRNCEGHEATPYEAKSYEAFRASVYEKAAIKKQNIRSRSRAIRNASLCAVMVAAVAVITGVGTRSNTPLPGGAAQYEAILKDSNQKPNKTGKSVDPQMLVLVKNGGESKAVVLKNREEQKAFVSQYGAAGMPKENADEKIIHSIDELSEYLAGLPGMADIEEEFDEAFFSANNLRAVPMDLTAERPAETTAPPPSQHTAPQTTAPPEVTAPFPTTIPDADTTQPEPEPSQETTAPFPSALTSAPPFPSTEHTSGLESLADIIRVFILVPVNKR